MLSSFNTPDIEWEITKAYLDSLGKKAEKAHGWKDSTLLKAVVLTGYETLLREEAMGSMKKESGQKL